MKESYSFSERRMWRQGHEEIIREVTVEINSTGIIDKLVWRAIRSKKKMATVLGGAVIVRVKDVT